MGDRLGTPRAVYIFFHFWYVLNVFHPLLAIIRELDMFFRVFPLKKSEFFLFYKKHLPLTCDFRPIKSIGKLSVNILIIFSFATILYLVRRCSQLLCSNHTICLLVCSFVCLLLFLICVFVFSYK